MVCGEIAADTSGGWHMAAAAGSRIEPTFQQVRRSKRPHQRARVVVDLMADLDHQLSAQMGARGQIDRTLHKRLGEVGEWRGVARRQDGVA